MFVDLSHFPMAPVTPQKDAAICQSHSEYRVATVYSLYLCGMKRALIAKVLNSPVETLSDTLTI